MFIPTRNKILYLRNDTLLFIISLNSQLHQPQNLSLPTTYHGKVATESLLEADFAFERATAYDGLGCAYRSLGEYDSAMDCHSQAIAILKNQYGDSHSETLAAIKNLSKSIEASAKKSNSSMAAFRVIPAAPTVTHNLLPCSLRYKQNR